MILFESRAPEFGYRIASMRSRMAAADSCWWLLTLASLSTISREWTALHRLERTPTLRSVLTSEVCSTRRKCCPQKEFWQQKGWRKGKEVLGTAETVLLFEFCQANSKAATDVGKRAVMSFVCLQTRLHKHISYTTAEATL